MSLGQQVVKLPALHGGYTGLQNQLAEALWAGQESAPSSLLAVLFNPMLFRVYSLTHRNRALALGVTVICLIINKRSEKYPSLCLWSLALSTLAPMGLREERRCWRRVWELASS